MNRFALLLSLPLACVLTASLPSALADDYVDDLYYTEAAAVEQQLKSGDLQPRYDKSRMQPLVFNEAAPASADTAKVSGSSPAGVPSAAASAAPAVPSAPAAAADSTAL